MPPDPALVIGLTGGVASGKSTVAALFCDVAQSVWDGPSLEIVDADRIAREVSARPEVVERIIETLGPEVRSAEGGLDRPATAALVFSDPQKLRALEAIVHPLVETEIRQRLAKADDERRSVLLDVPLLLERGWDRDCDVVVHVEVPAEVRDERARSRGWEPGERARREASQTPVAEKRRRAHHVVENDGDLARTRASVLAVLQSVVRGDPAS
jgi:dephospho-CoA kinase